VRWVVDASVAVEILLRTPIGVQAWAMVERAEHLAPDIMDAEVLSVLRREALGGRVAHERAHQALQDLEAWPIERVPSAPLLREAWGLRHNVSAYDALYVAVARVRAASLLTADGPLARAPGIGAPVHNIRIG
jgi:predicted nucleic acid-binding protein